MLTNRQLLGNESSMKGPAQAYERWISWLEEHLEKGNLEDSGYVWWMADVLVHGLLPLVRNGLKTRQGFVARSIQRVFLSCSAQEFGHCDMPRGRNQHPAYITLSRYLFFPGNGRVIGNTVLHELIHSVLPGEAQHGVLFQQAASAINGMLGSMVTVSVDRIEGRLWLRQDGRSSFREMR